MTGEARKQKIVRAALETIADHGIAGATVSRIARGAGVTAAALYSHFDNRRAILLAALDVVYEQIFDSLRSSASQDPVQRFKEICQNHAARVRDQDKTSHAHLFLEFVAAAPEEGLREALREKELATASYLASIVDELKRQGGLGEEVDPELIAWLVAAWAWTGDVASSMGVSSIWYERVSPRLIEFVLGNLDQGGTTRSIGGGPAGILREAGIDGLAEGAVFTIEEAADLLKVPPDTVAHMVASSQLRSLRLGDAVRIPRRALYACLRGMTSEEFDQYVEREGPGLKDGDGPEPCA
jgi:excisionase family DNA binding protein